MAALDVLRKTADALRGDVDELEGLVNELRSSIPSRLLYRLEELVRDLRIALENLMYVLDELSGDEG